MILSTFNNRTTAAALKRNGLATLALNAGGALGQERQDWRENPSRSISVAPQAASSVKTTAFMPVVCGVAGLQASSSNLGGSPSVGTPAPQGLAFGLFCMHAAPLTLDPGAYQQEGDA